MQDIVRKFLTDGEAVRCIQYGSGHINRTWLVETDRHKQYILQKVNTEIFPDPEGLMNNIILVTSHLRSKDPVPGHVLTLIPTETGAHYMILPGNELWRMYEFISAGVCLDRVESPDDFRLSGKAFGLFQRQMSDFDAGKLIEVIPGFHDTPSRYQAFQRAISKDRMKRAASVQHEIEFFIEREKTAGRMVEMLQKGRLPLRVTHNDTKLNNVMLDQKTREPLCILDLDTVMPGLVANDFGDSIRFGASTASEDEPDIGKVHLDLTLYEAYARGFLNACGKMLTLEEIETLPDGALLMTLECGVRFLTDYLEGDVYFHTSRSGHNLDRARTQMKLVDEMEQKDSRIRNMIRQLLKEDNIL